MFADVGEERHSGRRDQERRDERHPDAVTPDDVSGRVSADSGRDGERDESEAGHQRVCAEHVLEIERAQQEETEDRTGRNEHQEETAAHGAVGDPLDPQQRLLCPALPGCKGTESNEAERCEPDRLGRSPAGLIGLADRVDERGEAGGAEQGSGYVEATPARLLDIARDDVQGGRGERDSDGDVDVEDEAPVTDLGEDSADEDADSGTRTADSTPGRERLRALLALEAVVIIESAAGESMRRRTPGRPVLRTVPRRCLRGRRRPTRR